MLGDFGLLLGGVGLDCYGCLFSLLLALIYFVAFDDLVCFVVFGDLIWFVFDDFELVLGFKLYCL